MANTDQEGSRVDPGRLWAICCAADIPASLIDRFIEENQMYRDQLLCHFVVVDSLTETYMDETEIGDMEDEQNRTMTSPDSPFKNKSPEECYQLLVELREITGSDVDYIHFVIMDERSLTEDTVLLVVGPEDREEVEVKSVRVAFEMAHWHLVAFFDGEFTNIEEAMQAAAETEDGVLWVSYIYSRV